MTDELFVRGRDGTYTVELPEQLRAFIHRTASDLIPRIGIRDDLTWRLFPTTHEGDEAREAEYRDLSGSGLTQSRVAALEVVRDTVERERLGPEELDAWMRAIGVMRLVVDAIEPGPAGSDGAAAHEMTREALSWLQGEIVAALDPEYRDLR